VEAAPVDCGAQNVSRRRLLHDILVIYRMRGLFLFFLGAAALLGGDASVKRHQDYRAQAASAYAQKNYPAAKEATLAALRLRPDSPSYLHNLAALCALMEDTSGAFAALRQIDALGLAVPIERDPDFARLQGTPEFSRVLRSFASNREPIGTADIIAELPGRTGVLHGIAYRQRTGDLFLSDVHHRCIWRRDRSGQITRFTAEDEDLLGLFGIAIDEARNALWAAMRALPEMAGFTSELKGRTGLAEFNLATGELRRIVDIPDDEREHAITDLVVAADGTIYATDTKAPIIWQLTPGAEDFQKTIDSPIFASLQGLVIAESRLIVADYEEGLFAVEIPSGRVTALPAPPNTALLGLNGLLALPGRIIASQIGVNPPRALQVVLNANFDAITAVTVLAAGLPEFADLALIATMNGQPTIIAQSGWDRFDPSKMKQPPAHNVKLFQIALP